MEWDGRNVAIIGTGPTGIYTFYSLIKKGGPFSITLYEQKEKAGVGMPYSESKTNRLMLANIASIEIPPLLITYLDWLKQQSEEYLARFDVDKHHLDKRQFLPRTLLGAYFRHQFLTLLEMASTNGHRVSVRESCEVTDIEHSPVGVKLWVNSEQSTTVYDHVVIATGHEWPDKEKATRHYFPSPWSGLLEANIEASKVGIMGTSLSAIDAAMAVVAQHGDFIEVANGEIRFDLDNPGSELQITLMSRSGILPEADFYCPIPHEPLKIATPEAIQEEISVGSKGLLDRAYRLMAKEIHHNDPNWAQRVSLDMLNVDQFVDAYFQDRAVYNPFRWAAHNLSVVEINKKNKHTVPWRYTILRLHERLQEIVPYLDECDRQRFDSGLSKVFTDNYAAIPPESIRRLLALRQAGIIDVLKLGYDYEKTTHDGKVVIDVGENRYLFDVFIDARGQRSLSLKDLPFQHLKKQVLDKYETSFRIQKDYTLQTNDKEGQCIILAAIPYLMKDKPFIQGITVSAEIGKEVAQSISRDVFKAVAS